MFTKSLTPIAILGLGLAATPAFAGDSESLEACKDALAADTLTPAGDIEFRSLSGGGVQKFSFRVGEGDAAKAAVCKVKRGKIVEIIYPTA